MPTTQEIQAALDTLNKVSLHLNSIYDGPKEEWDKACRVLEEVKDGNQIAIKDDPASEVKVWLSVMA